ncbi:magnesium transporter [Candidatus Mycoplasma haematohominis]|uniref:magnesium transporter n=1 Tax=Candidatus Mycoplasma haematohominis TaxID=1494318 RepID=UPI001C0A71FB|nr:magnesium transporter [Candidatus Mycoplasma haemohominis]
MFRKKIRKEEATYDSKVESVVEKINFLYQEKNDLGIKTLLKNQPINLLVDALEKIDSENVAIRFLIVAQKMKMGELFLSFGEALQLRILNTMKSGVITHLLEDLNSDDVYEIFAAATVPIQRKIIFNASKRLKEEIKQLKSFDFAEVGSIMNVTYLSLSENMSVSEAIDFLKKHKAEFDISEEIFVVNSNGVIVGQVNTQKLFFLYLDKCSTNNSEINIGEITEKSFMSVSERDDIDIVSDLFRKYSIKTLAVINNESKLVGIIDYQDVIPEILDSNIEDVHKFYGIKETKRSYLNSSILEIVKSRITCLIIMLFVATITTFAIDKFESLGVMYTAGISTAILVPIIPIITDMCGNTGSQTTATVIQAYSLGELKESDFWKVVKKELKVATVIGAILAVCNFVRLFFYFIVTTKTDLSGFQAKVHTGTNTSDKLNPMNVYLISLVGAAASSLSLWLVVIFSKFFGVLIPCLAIKFNLDPASVSAPLLTTVLDTIASIIFFGIGVLLLHFAISGILGVTITGGKLST